MKTINRIIICATVIIIVIVAVATFYMVDFALNGKQAKEKTSQQRYGQLFKSCPEVKPWVDSLQKAKALRDTFVTMKSGERHHALYMFAHRKSNKAAILVHGYKNSGINMLHIAEIYARMGYNILLPDLHAHDLSEGEDIQMGWKERWDVLQWAAVANDLFKDSTHTTRQVLHGISMGAATVMCVSGENTPEYIKCFVEDCGYTSVWDEFASEFKNMYGLPSFPILHTSNLLCQARYGWNFREASPLNQVKKCRKPMLFIHGSNDTFVPSHMVYSLYEAKPDPKEIFIAQGSAHARSYQDHPKQYTKKIKEFVEQAINR